MLRGLESLAIGGFVGGALGMIISAMVDTTVGVSIGLLLGIAVSLADFCEFFEHEAADFPTDCRNADGTEVLTLFEAVGKAASGTSMHGVAGIYSGARGRRMFWMLLVSIGLFFAVFFSLGVIKNYFSKAKVTSVSVKTVSKFYFPDVTVCGAVTLFLFFLLFSPSLSLSLSLHLSLFQLGENGVKMA